VDTCLSEILALDVLLRPSIGRGTTGDIDGEPPGDAEGDDDADDGTDGSDFEGIMGGMFNLADCLGVLYAFHQKSHENHIKIILRFL
jgi:hypothetical protein